MFLWVTVHTATCFLHFLSTNENIRPKDTSLSENSLNSQQIYVKTLYYVVTTISTVGYGDITPKTSKEIAFVMFLQLLGVIIFAYITGTITSILMNFSQREKMLSENELNLDKWMLDINTNNTYQINTELQNEIQNYFKYFWENDHSSLLKNNSFLMRMPLKLRDKFIDYLFSDEIKDFSVFFAEYDHELKNNLMLHLYPRIFEENAFILKIHENVDDIYIIRRGTVFLQSPLNIKFLSLSEKSFFGEEYALFNKKVEVDFITDIFGVECFCIKKSKYLELLNQHPKTFECVLKRAFKRSKYFKAIMISSCGNDQVDTSKISFSKNRTDRNIANDYINSFSWNFSQEEIDELTRYIAKNEEITAKEKICKNLNKNIVCIQKSIEKLSDIVEELKHHYENDYQKLFDVVRLFKDGHALEANDLLSKLNFRS